MTRTRLELLQWFGLFGGALAWAVEHVVGYGVGDAACNVAGRQWGLPATTAQIVLGVAAGAVVLAAESAALLVFRATQQVEENAAGPAGRLHFFAEVSLLGNVLFFMIVLLDVVSTVYHLPCRQS
jgi:hypothetical protein